MIYTAQDRIIGSNFYPNGLFRPKAPMGGSAPPAVWAPTDKSGLLFWFKTDAGVTESGGLVSAWADQSGNGRDASQSSGALQPTYTAGVLNSKPGISFPSGTYLNFGTDVLFDVTGTFSLVIVTKDTVEGGTYYHTACSVFTNEDSNSVFSLLFSNDTNYGDGCYAAMNGTPGAMVKVPGDFSTNAVSFLMNYVGGLPTVITSYSSYRNNVALTQSVAGPSAVGQNQNRLGCWWDGSLNLVGSIFEIFAYDTSVSSGEAASIQSYVSSAARWAI